MSDSPINRLHVEWYLDHDLPAILYSQCLDFVLWSMTVTFSNDFCTGPSVPFHHSLLYRILFIRLPFSANRISSFDTSILFASSFWIERMNEIISLSNFPLYVSIFKIIFSLNSDLFLTWWFNHIWLYVCAFIIINSITLPHEIKHIRYLTLHDILHIQHLWS